MGWFRRDAPSDGDGFYRGDAPVLMPGMDGVTLLSALRRHADFAQTPAVFMTARGTDVIGPDLTPHGVAGVERREQRLTHPVTRRARTRSRRCAQRSTARDPGDDPGHQPRSR